MIALPASSVLRRLIAGLLLVVICLLPHIVAHAQSQDGDGKYLLSEGTYNTLSKINELLETEKYAEALNKLRSLESNVEGNTYEEAVVQQTMGYAYNGLQQYERAAESFINAVRSNALPADVSHRLDYFIAQLLAQTEDYERAISYLNKWLTDEPEPDLEAYRLAAGLYYETGNYEQVIKHARAAISRSRQANESLYQLLLAAYFETGKYSSAAELLQNMLQLFPDDKTYWKQLYATYQLLKKDKRALAIYELAYRRGLLTSEEKEELARLYLHLQDPYRAARFMQREMDTGGINKTVENMKLLAQSYFMAHETDKAIEAYGEAAEMSGDGELYFRQGQLLANQQQWQRAQSALQEALKAGKLKHRAQAQLLLGIAAYKLENDKTAREALRQASQDKNTREQAEYWLQQIQDRG